MAETKYVSRENLSAILSKIKATYVQKVEGKGLSTNDFTTELLNKLTGISAGAQVNVIEKISVNGTQQTITEKGVDIAVPTKVSELTNDSNYLTQVTESNLDSELAAKVNAAAEGNHSHANKAELDKIAEGDKAKWDTAAGNVTTLVGSDSGKSARTIAAEELAKQLIPETAAESLNELTEIAAWIQSHPGDAAAMNAAITALQNQLSGIDAGTGTVKKYVDDAITALKIGDYAKAADLTALAGRVTTLEGKAHTHANQSELDKIATGDKAKWDAVAADYVKASELVALTEAEIEEIWANA